MTETTAEELTAAVTRLRLAGEQQEALAPLRRLLTDADEEARAAAQQAAAAGLSERKIAAELNVAQPTVHAYLDRRAADPVPAPDIAARAWSLHHLATALASQVLRLKGHRLPERAPSANHGPPTTLTSNAYTSANEAADSLGRLAAALDYGARKQA